MFCKFCAVTSTLVWLSHFSFSLTLIEDFLGENAEAAETSPPSERGNIAISHCPMQILQSLFLVAFGSCHVYGTCPYLNWHKDICGYKSYHVITNIVTRLHTYVTYSRIHLQLHAWSQELVLEPWIYVAGVQNLTEAEGTNKTNLRGPRSSAVARGRFHGYRFQHAGCRGFRNFTWRRCEFAQSDQVVDNLTQAMRDNQGITTYPWLKL